MKKYFFYGNDNHRELYVIRKFKGGRTTYFENCVLLCFDEEEVKLTFEDSDDACWFLQRFSEFLSNPKERVLKYVNGLVL